jgi:CRISPR-associated protein Csd2
LAPTTRPASTPRHRRGWSPTSALKRKVRDYVFHSEQEDGKQKHGYDIFVLAGNTLESRQRMPFDHLKLDNKEKAQVSNIALARTWMCENFFDVRAFGAVMSTTEFNCGQVRGPIQLTFARSTDPILSTEHTISRQAFTGEKDIKNSTGTFGKKHTIAYTSIVRTASSARPSRRSAPTRPKPRARVSPKTTCNSFGRRSAACST